MVSFIGAVRLSPYGPVPSLQCGLVCEQSDIEA